MKVNKFMTVNKFMIVNKFMKVNKSMKDNNVKKKRLPKNCIFGMYAFLLKKAQMKLATMLDTPSKIGYKFD